MTTSYLGTELGQFLDLVANRDAAPGGGAVAAVSVSLAAGLAAMAARLSSRQVADGETLAADADAVRRRAADLAGEDAEAYMAVLAAYAGAKTAAATAAATHSDDEIRAALDRAARVPLEVTALGARTALLAARLAREGNPRLRGDATTAVLISIAAARSACELVRINVADGAGDQSLLAEAAQNVQTAEAARRTIHLTLG
jgi:formiminotetrahydrofolate cyclodeaminase